MEKIAQGSNTLVDEISAIPGGEGVRLCIQCGTCSASCPNASRMDHTPRELIAMARAGLRDEVLSSKAPWLCLSCYLCTVRCPRGIKQTDFMHALECLADRHHLSNTQTSTPTMYRSFSHFVRRTGNLPEMAFTARFYMMTKNPWRAIRMTPVALSLFRHGRLSFKSRKLKPEAERQLKAILDKAEAQGGTS